MIPIDPLRSHPPFGPPYNASNSIDSIATGHSEINRYIWGDNPAPADREVIVRRVYAKLRLENSPVLAYFDRGENCDLVSALPRDVRRDFERVIGAQVQRS
ncbi:hypothetical protein E0Z10_g9767 [Xylaria hypoxylon]|uniref:Uncharacterized protein n=1 Tax=Xylaria hypoxylon TaxID=37992 RepID=A0A4Z0Y4J9_9PEZI|nr:hypothetical protein E0Z10_g9767 [Xylaria hypoxylon]